MASPKLARQRFSVDSDDDDSDDDSLDIQPPVAKQQQQQQRQTPLLSSIPSSIHPKTFPKPSGIIDFDFSSDDDSDGDEVLQRAKAMLEERRKRVAPSGSASSLAINRSAPSSSSSKEATTKSRHRQQKDRLRTLEARLQQKRETQQRKVQEKEARAHKRQAEKMEKERKKLKEKQTKKRQLEETKQSTGKFANLEICVLMDPDVYHNEEFALVDSLSDDFLMHCYPSALTCQKAVQWIRKDYLQGGAKGALERLEDGQTDHFEHLQFVMLILEADDFIPLIQKADKDDDDYPELTEWLETLTARWQQVWNIADKQQKPRYIFLLHRVNEALDKMWVNHRKQKRKGDISPPTSWDLSDALNWLLIQHQVETVDCPSLESIQANVHKLTRGLCEAPYVSQVTELQCVKKIKQGNPSADDDLSKARDCWLRQLQQIPRLSETMAQNVVRQYPTLQSLWQAYQRNDGGREMLLVNILSGNRSQAKLSETVYKFMLSDDPREMIV